MTGYFAYGSNMASAQMAERCHGATSLGAARLEGFALAFDRWSDRRGGYVADVVPRPGEVVWGVLWRVTTEHLLSLDRYEGVAAGAYRRESVRVTLAADPSPEAEAIVYRVCQPGVPGPPAMPYLNLMLEGAREHGLPPAYIATLAASVSLGGIGQKR